MANDQPPVSSVFRWAGSKRQLLPALEAHWKTSYKRYVEPFAGSAALFFRLSPQKALLGDINGELIEALGVIREEPDSLYYAVKSLRRSKNRYYELRGTDPTKLTRFSRAIRFVYLNRYCFNGIYRTNTKGQFNVPYAKIKPGILPPIEAFRNCAALLLNADLRCLDFGRILSSVRAGDFVYLDPPYAVSSRRIFRQYDKREFTERDLVRLAKHLNRVDRIGAAFVLSYADSSEARRHFCGWPYRRIKVRRNIAGFAGARRNAYELLVTNRPLD